MQLLQHFKELTVRPKNVHELKGLILQLAIQGKLTANWRKENPDVEAASTLLKEVQKDKEQLIKANKIKKEKALSSLSKEEIPYEIPKSWKWYKLAELSSINGGFAFKSTNYKKEGARVIRISDFDENGFKNHKIVRHSFTNDLDSFVLEDKNILIAMTGGTVGKSLFVDKVPEIMIVNQRVATIKIFKPIYEAYINCVIPTRLIQDVINEAKNSTNDNISMSDIKGFKIPLPPLEEQKAIVEVVETLFKEVEQLEQLTVERISLKEKFVVSALNQLTTNDAKSEWTFLQDHFQSFFNEKNTIKKLRETVLQLAVQGKLTRAFREIHPELVMGSNSASELLKRIQKEKAQLIKDKKIKKEKPLRAITKDEVPYELPVGWVWCRLGNFGDIYGGSTPSKARSVYWDGNIPWVSSKDMKSIEISKTELGITELGQIENRNRIVPINSILMVTRSGILKRHFPVSINVIPCTVNQDLKVITPVFQDLGPYIRLMLHGHEKMILTELVKGGTTVQSVEFDKLLAKPFPYPPLEEQKAIVQKVNALMGLCDALEQEVRQSQEQSERLMQSCLREVFEGKESRDYKTENLKLGMAAEDKTIYK